MSPVQSAIRINAVLAGQWARLGTRFMPFADAATRELPMGRLLRLSLFQVSVGMALALLNGTLNRVMIVEMHVPAWLVSLMVALPLVFAPFRALVGHKSDTHVSALGWRRVPYIWMGSLLQFGGLAIMPFALLVLSGDTHGPILFGQLGAGLAFLLVGAGLHTTQTAGLALATDLAPAESRSRVVALMYVMLLLGMVGSALAFGVLLADFKQVKLIQVVQGAAALTMVLNMAALWKQEARNPSRTTAAARAARPAFRESWRQFVEGGRASRLLVAVALGSAAFSMQDILLEPYGGQIMGLGVGATSALTALLAGGSLAAFALASRWLLHGGDPCRLAGCGALVGVVAFASVLFAHPMDSPLLFRVGAILIGFGGGLFSVGTLTAAMGLEDREHNGLALGAWGAVQASATGIAIAAGGALRDVFSGLAIQGALGPALTGPAVGYSLVYQLEIALLFATLVAIGPLVRASDPSRTQAAVKFGLAELPG
jgi:BCD family chlorophyll transporter-like MFS transporter